MNDFPNTESLLWDRVMFHYPAPIAAAARNLRGAGTKKDEHDALLDLLEIAAMTVATVLASQFTQDGKFVEGIDKLFLDMGEPDFGTWVSFILKVAKHYAAEQTQSIGGRFSERLREEIPAPASRAWPSPGGYR